MKAKISCYYKYASVANGDDTRQWGVTNHWTEVDWTGLTKMSEIS